MGNVHGILVVDFLYYTGFVRRQKGSINFRNACSGRHLWFLPTCWQSSGCRRVLRVFHHIVPSFAFFHGIARSLSDLPANEASYCPRAEMQACVFMPEKARESGRCFLILIRSLAPPDFKTSRASSTMALLLTPTAVWLCATI